MEPFFERLRRQDNVGSSTGDPIIVTFQPQATPMSNPQIKRGRDIVDDVELAQVAFPPFVRSSTRLEAQMGSLRCMELSAAPPRDAPRAELLLLPKKGGKSFG